MPAPAALRGSWLLAERGSRALQAMRRVQGAGGGFLLRANAGMQPQGVAAWREDGTRRRSLRHKPRKAIDAKRPKRQRVAHGGAGQGAEPALRLRLLRSWNRRAQAFCSL